MACTSPGSRCAPLVLTLAREQRLECHSHIDERCAGFFALGAAKASGLPVAVTCTSGTAAAELLPAAIEAREARVPLLLLTRRPPAGAARERRGAGDRPAEALRRRREVVLRGRDPRREPRAGALDQDARVPRLLDRARGPPGGGAPELPAARAARDRRGATGRRHRPRRGQAVRAPRTNARRRRDAPGRTRRRNRGAASWSPGATSARPRSGYAAAAFCEAIGWPLLADPLSGARRGAAAVAHYDALLRDESFAASHRPDLVLRVGDLPVSKPLRTWLAGLENVRQVALDPEGAWQDPASVLSDSLALEPAAALAELTACRDGGRRPRSADDAHRHDLPPLSPRRPGLARELAQRR